MSWRVRRSVLQATLSTLSHFQINNIGTLPYAQTKRGPGRGEGGGYKRSCTIPYPSKPDTRCTLN